MCPFAPRVNWRVAELALTSSKCLCHCHSQHHHWGTQRAAREEKKESGKKSSFSWNWHCAWRKASLSPPRGMYLLMSDQTVKNLPAVQEIWVQSLGREDPLEKGMATHSSVLAWRSPWTEEPTAGYSAWDWKKLDTTEQLTLSLLSIFFG